ncbi:unnamed protein product [Thlaspi arvense]|uniref:Uncharacterized protein n=1 Tax=Thlaspi arvense TaxID=13288 RepID=A0AAU9S170_THLAR|nr:unnamed protein product [Thlaspi arvense]
MSLEVNAMKLFYGTLWLQSKEEGPDSRPVQVLALLLQLTWEIMKGRRPDSGLGSGSGVMATTDLGSYVTISKLSSLLVKSPKTEVKLDA